MIVICVITAVTGLFIYALLKIWIDEWIRDFSMKRQSRLSLKRNNDACDTCIELVEISDDDSFGMSSNIQKSTTECTNVTSYEATKVPSTLADASSAGCNSKHLCDISDDLSSDEDISVIDDAPDTFNKSQSMFNWSKPIFPTKALYQNIFPENNASHGSRFTEVTPIEAVNKKQKLMNDSISSISSTSDDELIKPNILKKDSSPPEVKIQYDRMIAGTKVKFPVKPYPCQISVMNGLIQGCNKEQNSLLESPTGSGKTLALLCGALAWQEQYSEKICREASGMPSDGMNAESSCCDKNVCDDSLNDNFFLNSSQYIDEEWCDKVLSKDKARRLPKIYYGTRTHKQIEQVIREFRKTAYRHKRMTILSSRDQTCIQKSTRDKTELCNELLDPLKGKKCPYYSEHSKRKMPMFSRLNTPWDIEELVSFGKNISCCPYFGARSLMVDADIIFCTYQYILDPNIREVMQINLKGNIVILDEAHNIEDTCRDAASVDLRDDEIANAAKESQHLLKKGCDPIVYNTIQEYLANFVKFLKIIDVDYNNCDNEVISKQWLGTEFRELLNINNVGNSTFSDFLAVSRMAIQDFVKNMKEENPEKMMPTISRETKTVLEQLCFAMQMIVSDIFVNDYRAYIVETVEVTKKTVHENVWISSNTSGLKAKVRTMKLKCMNPAVVFAPLANTVRSVILASGTLSPTMSFQSELGTQFPNLINPNHIIPKEQVYVRCIPQGPNGIHLKATYENVNSFIFQDELGELILQVCDAVPYGVLCFFSSYPAMNKFLKRWKNNRVWDKLSKLKEIFVEPPSNKDLQPVMAEYRKAIKESSSKSFRTACGAILFAVFRGKVAEGIDFSDNEARCVLAVGIPYLHKNALSMKMDYNDSNVSKGLLSGKEWYTVHAFRALNQGIGRCVRHKDDWGAVLLVDQRFQESKNTDHLPKWIKTNLRNASDRLEIGLQNFVALQAARERGEECMEK